MRGTPQGSGEVEHRALRALAHTVAGVVAVRVLPGPTEDGGRDGVTAPADAGAPAER
jgi:hypothetical protein